MSTYAIANLSEPGVLETAQAVCTPDRLDNSVAHWADVQYRQSVTLYPKDEHDETYLHIEREEDIEPVFSLLAETGVYLTPYYPYVGEGWV